MIASTVGARGDLGLDGLVLRNLALLEHGLTCVAADLDLADVALTLLARDAAGAPVLVFADDGNATMPVAARAARLHAHLSGNPWLLQRVFPHKLPSQPVLRVLVVGFRFDDLALATLRALALPDLRVLELHDWTAAGKRHWAVRPVLSRPDVRDDGFTVPSALPAHLAGQAGELLAWLERLDADVAVTGDRFSRQVVARGRPLCVLSYAQGALNLTLPGGEPMPLLVRDDAVTAMDQVMARFEQSLRGDCAPAGAEPALPLDLGELRRSVSDVRLTRDECAALQRGDGLTRP